MAASVFGKTLGDWIPLVLENSMLVGDGAEVDFWRNNWLGDGLLLIASSVTPSWLPIIVGIGLYCSTLFLKLAMQLLGGKKLSNKKDRLVGSLALLDNLLLSLPGTL